MKAHLKTYHYLLSLVLLVSLVMTQGGLPVKAEGGGYIQGHIRRAADNSAIPGAIVGLFEYSSLTGNWVRVGSGTSSGSDGGYILSDVASGVYGVHVTASGYADQWYGGVFLSRDAAAITVNAPGIVDNIDFSLQPGGSISGTVTSASSGLPLENISLDFWKADNSGVGGWLTDGSGHYTFSGLPYGQYKVGSPSGGRWGSGDGNYIIQIHNHKNNIDSADLVTVSAETPHITGIDFSLVQGGVISGFVYQTNGSTGLSGANIALFEYSSLSGWWVEVGKTSSGSDGSYTLSGVPTGIFGVHSTAQGYADQWYGGAFKSGEAIPVSVTAPNTQTGIDFTMQPGGSISGTIRAASSTLPLANVSVDLWTVDNAGVGGGLTDGSGKYTFSGLPYGQYKIGSPAGGRWGSNDDGYITRIFNNKDNINNADLVNVSAGTPIITGIDIYLVQGGSISGRVVDENQQPIFNCHVLATDYASNTWKAGTFTAVDGTYTLSGLAGGNYRVRAVPSNKLLPYADTFFNNTYSYPEAQPVIVSSGEITPAINFTLVPGGSISGTVISAGTSLPLANVSVSAGLQSITGAGWGNTTNQSGNYTIGGLPYGQYKVNSPVGFGSGDSGLAPEFYNNRSNWIDADIVEISASIPARSGINFSLGQGGFVSGTVTAGGTPLADIQVSATETGSNQFVNGTRTNGDGIYTLTLPPGSYFIQARPSGTVQPYLDQYYEGVFSTQQATSVSVTAGTNTSGIDFALTAAGIITGTVASGGVPLSNIQVNATDASSNQFITGSRTNSNGVYNLNLPTGNYKLQARPSDTASPYANTYYDGVTLFSQATPVSVSIAVTRGDVDFNLAPGGSISGHVYERGSSPPVPISGATVSIHDDDLWWIAGGTTASDGSYKIFGIPAGNIRAQAWAPAHVKRWHGDTLFYPSAIVFDPPVNMQGIDFLLEEGGSISGHVASHGLDLANINVVAWNNEHTIGSLATTNSSGNYEIRGLPLGDYVVKAPAGIGSTDTAYVIQYYQNQPDETSANIVTVSTSAGTGGIDFALSTAPGNQISGYVYDNATGNPLPGVLVILLPIQTGQASSSVFTGVDGSYTATGLPAGSYRVLAVSGGHIQTLWNNVLKLSQATLIAISDSQGAANINFRLEVGNPITGTVTSGGAGVGNISIAFQSADDPEMLFLTFSSAVPGHVGSYSINVPGGHYKVRAPSGLTNYEGNPAGAADASYIQQYYNHQPDEASANILNILDNGVTTQIDFNLTGINDIVPGNEIRGYVYDRVTGNPISNAIVIFLPTRTGQESTNVFTGTDGSYTATGLPAGSYRVLAAASGHDQKFWDDVWGFLEATLVTITDSQGAANISFRLETGNAIIGKITSGGIGVGNVSIAIQSVDNPDLTWLAFSSTIPGQEGNYIINVPEGNYKIRAPSGFTNGEGNPIGSADAAYFQQYYNHQPDEASANVVLVLQSEAVTGIDFALTVKGFTIIPASLPDGETKTGYEPVTLAATGGTLPYKWSKSGDWPTGLRLDPKTGVISGKISSSLKEAKEFKFLVTATDSAKPKKTTSRSFSIKVHPGMVLSTPTAADAGSPYSCMLAVTGGVAPYSFSKGSLWPDWLHLDEDSGELTGDPDASGSAKVNVIVEDSLGYILDRTLTIKVNKPLKITQYYLPISEEGITFKKTTFKATGGTGKYSWDLTGELPGGVVFDAKKGVFSGKPENGSRGDYPLTVQVNDGVAVVSTHVTLVIKPQPSITTTSLPEGAYKNAYNASLAAENGVPPYKWSRVGGKLPPGLTLDSKTGTISGTPKQTGQFTFSIKVTDSLKGYFIKEFTIIVN